MNKILLFIYFLSFTVFAKAQAIDFTYNSSNGLYCNPSAVQFIQSSTGNPTGFAWTFGNGARSNDPNPAITYANPGTYNVKLIVIYSQYAVEVNKTIVINPSITTSIGYDRNYICTPGIINFTASGTGNIGTYNWDFGDGSNVTSGSPNVSHNFLNFGVYTITLKATDVTGCYAIATTTIEVKLPAISGTLSPIDGCVPSNVNFNANVIIPVNSSVTNYTWNFKDGSPNVSTNTNSTNHVYNVAGGYIPLLTITTSDGCTNTYKFDTIAFGTPPINHVAYPFKQTICGSEKAVFFSKATNANAYYWDFGDGIKQTVKDTLAGHKFGTLGTKTITVTPLYNNCKGTPITFQINVIGVIATYTYSNTCSDKKTFSFTNTSQGNQSSLSWNFGDGSPSVNTINPVHTFPSSGSFVTTITIADNITGCNDVYSQTIYTANPTLINQDSAICKNSNTYFSISNNYNNSSAIYKWDAVGMQVGTYTDPNLTIKGSIFGNFNGFVMINNGSQYCQDTIQLNHKILVRGPIVDFAAPDTICSNSGYSVTNNSRPYMSVDTIKGWFWDFGNTGFDINFNPKPYLFNNPGVYNVKLFGVDKNGCKDSTNKNVTVKPIPFLRVIPAVDTLCLGQTTTLIAFHNDPIIWSNANQLTCGTCDTVVATPTGTTKYYVTATNNLNCSSTDSVLVKVYTPFTATPLLSDLYICPNDSVKLNIDPPMKKILWSPATGLSMANNYGPMASPFQTTTYTATLTDSLGCFTSSADINVHVKSKVTVNAGPDKVYPYYSNFSINPSYSNNVVSYLWTPSSSLNCSNCAVPSGIATITTKYFIRVTSDSGCVSTDTINIFVECNNANILMPTAFTPNGDNLNDYYFPITRGIKSILRFSIYNREGNLVYEARNFPPNNKAFGWNGKHQNMDLSSSVFVYYLEALCDVGEKLYRKGSVVLVR